MRCRSRQVGLFDACAPLLGLTAKVAHSLRNVAEIDEHWLALLGCTSPALKCARRDSWISLDLGWSPTLQWLHPGLKCILACVEDGKRAVIRSIANTNNAPRSRQTSSNLAIFPNGAILTYPCSRTSSTRTSSRLTIFDSDSKIELITRVSGSSSMDSLYLWWPSRAGGNNNGLHCHFADLPNKYWGREIMRIQRDWLFGIRVTATALMLAGSLPIQADQTRSAKGDAFDSVMATYTVIQWRDNLNPSYANLGNDQFLVDTRLGLLLWDEPSNNFNQPVFPPSIDAATLNLFNETDIAWARLGNSPADTLVNISMDGGSDQLPRILNTLLWWDGNHHRFAAALSIAKTKSAPHLLSLGPHHALLCTRFNGSKVVRLHRTDGKSSMMLAESEDIEALAALQSTGVVGKVDGFEELTETNITRPVYYDTSHCGWEIRNLPDIAIKPFLDRKTRKSDLLIKPYFLADGQILLSEVEYFDGQYWRNMNPPLLWRPKTQSWAAIEHTSGDGGGIHRAGQGEPVMSYAFQSKIVEFLDTKSMHWVRSRQVLPDGYDANIEPLSNGNAVVFMRDNPGGQVGLIAPTHDDLPIDKLELPRYRYDGEIALHDGGLMLVGGGDEWNPSVRSEIVDAKLVQAHPIASLPIPLVSPYGLALKDNSILVFGGLPARCGPSFYWSEQCRHLLAQSSFRYFPQGNRWQTLQNLTIPFTKGYAWETGNSGLASQWSRNDALVRKNGDVVWIEGGEAFGSANEKLPQTSLLKRWRLENQNTKSEIVASLRKGRTKSTLIELADGRLSVIGGYAQIGQVAPERKCSDCPNEPRFDGTFVPARSTEVLDESSKNAAVWNAGPKAHYGGGRAMKLANGRIFKLSLTGDFDSEGYRTEIADAAFTQWERLPPFPLEEAVIRNVGAAGNLVVILTNKKQTVVWDDDAKTWLVWKDWPKGAGNKDDRPISISALADGKRVLIRYGSSFDIVNLP